MVTDAWEKCKNHGLYNVMTIIQYASMLSIQKQKIIVIVGPTASGKSELAVRLAKRFKGEIISADSRQVYKGLDIGTAKVPGRWVAKNGRNIFVYKGVPHHLIDVASAKRTFTAAEFKEKAQQAITDIASRGKIPIIAGGTAFWIDALMYDIALPEVPPNPALRTKLARMTTDQLAAILQYLDPDRATAVDTKNPRRLARAIEIASALGKVPSVRKRHPYKALWLGIYPPDRAILEKSLSRRAKSQIRRGLLSETKKLLSRIISKKRMRELGFEYALALDYLKGEITKKELHWLLTSQNIQYAKRQMTWFKKNREITWIHNTNTAGQLTRIFVARRDKK